LLEIVNRSPESYVLSPERNRIAGPYTGRHKWGLDAPQFFARQTLGAPVRLARCLDLAPHG